MYLHLSRLHVMSLFFLIYNTFILVHILDQYQGERDHYLFVIVNYSNIIF